MYLEAEEHKHNDIALEKERRIQLEAKRILLKLTRSTTINRGLKSTLYKTLIRLVATNGSETCCMSVEHERK